MTGRAFAAGLVVVFVAGCASAQPRPDVRITADRAAADGCTQLGIVRDDDFDDMAKKAARMGGDTVILFAATTGAQPGWIGPIITQVHSGEVYRCR